MFYVMSDIHGNEPAFQSILSQINLTEDDTLFVLGDVIDRHEHGVAILQQIMTMKNVKCLLGNHELMCLNAVVPPGENLPWTRDDPDRSFIIWMRNGGRDTLRDLQNLCTQERDALVSWLKTLPAEYDVEVNGRKYKLVHASPGELYQCEGITVYCDTINFSVWNRIDDLSRIPGV